MAEDNIDELVSPVTSVKDDSVTEDNTDELVSPVTTVKNDSIAEDNTDELASPITSLKDDPAGSKPDEISSGKPTSLSNRHKVLPCYRNSSNSSTNGGNARRQSTGKLDSTVSGQDVLPHYLRASTGSCHDFCKYGRKHTSEAKPWHPLSKRKNILPANEHSPAGTMVGEAKKRTAIKQKPAITAGTMLGEEKKVTGAERKGYTPPGSMQGEAKKGTVSKQKPSTTSGSNLGEAKKGTLVKKKPYTPPGSVLGEGKVVNVVNQKPSVPLESIPGDGKKLAVVEQNSSLLGSMLGEEDEVTVFNQKPSTPPESMLGEEKKVIVVERKPSVSSESMLGEGEEVTAVEQKLSTPPGTMLGEGKKVSVVNQKPLKSGHSPKLDSSSDKVPKTEKKLKFVSAKPSSLEQKKLKMVKSSSKVMGGADGGGRKGIDTSSRKQTIVSKVSAENPLNTPTASRSPRSSSIKPLILRARNNKSLKLLAPLKDLNKLRRDGTNKLNPENVPEKTLHVIKEEASQKSSTRSRSRSSSNEEGKKLVTGSADSKVDKYTSSSKKMLHTKEAEHLGKMQKKTLRKGKADISDDCNPSVVKLKFRRGKIVDLQQETSLPRRLTFRWGRHAGEGQDSKGDTRRRIFKKKGVDGDKSSIISGKIVLRHQDVQEKKDAQGLLNNVIEETASKLVESKKSKVKALVGAFETVISLQDKPATVTVS